MKAPQRGPGAKTGAESAEVRKARNGAGSRAVGQCGKSAEKVRKLNDPSLPCLPSPSACPDSGPAVAQPLALVRARADRPRESCPAWPPSKPAARVQAPVEAAQVLARLMKATAAIGELLSLLPPPVHRPAVDLAMSAATCSPAPSAGDVADAAGMLARMAGWHMKKAAPVLSLVEARRCREPLRPGDLVGYTQGSAHGESPAL